MTGANQQIFSNVTMLLEREGVIPKEKVEWFPSGRSVKRRTEFSLLWHVYMSIYVPTYVDSYVLRTSLA